MHMIYNIHQAHYKIHVGHVGMPSSMFMICIQHSFFIRFIYWGPVPRPRATNSGAITKSDFLNVHQRHVCFWRSSFIRVHAARGSLRDAHLKCCNGVVPQNQMNMTYTKHMWNDCDLTRSSSYYFHIASVCFLLSVCSYHVSISSFPHYLDPFDLGYVCVARTLQHMMSTRRPQTVPHFILGGVHHSPQLQPDVVAPSQSQPSFLKCALT
jgi:hypothetical protein